MRGYCCPSIKQHKQEKKMCCFTVGRPQTKILEHACAYYWWRTTHRTHTAWHALAGMWIYWLWAWVDSARKRWAACLSTCASTPGVCVCVCVCVCVTNENPINLRITTKSLQCMCVCVVSNKHTQIPRLILTFIKLIVTFITTVVPQSWWRTHSTTWARLWSPALQGGCEKGWRFRFSRHYREHTQAMRWWIIHTESCKVRSGAP